MQAVREGSGAGAPPGDGCFLRKTAWMLRQDEKEAKRRKKGDGSKQRAAGNSTGHTAMKATQAGAQNHTGREKG